MKTKASKKSSPILSESKSTVIVGIGASAGGLEALQEFFKNVPLKTGLAFVVIQHLSPDHKSLMDELLARCTRLPINIIKDGMPIEPDNIYLIPPRKNISLFHGKLYLKDQDQKKALNLPVDIFFRSLALEKGKDTIGIILSGTGSDGTLGTRAIKEAGGMVMVQDENSAKFDGMPRNSISTGLVDYILPPDKMPEALVNYIKHPLVKNSQSLDNLLNDDLDTLTKIIIILKEYSGIDFSYYKENTIVRRLERRVSINHFDTLEEYLSFLSESDKEKETLNRELLIGVTRFFRDADAFEILKEKVLPLLSEKKHIRIWTAACSTGEEVYSLAIMLKEYNNKHNIDCDIKIFATDIDRNSIDYASKGFYPDSIVSDISPFLLGKYFTKTDAGYQVNDSIRKLIVFATHNLLKDSPFSRLDIISCRNLFIYLKPNVQNRLLSVFYYSLNPDGHLFMGSSETIGDMTEAFECVDPKWKIYRHKYGYKSKEFTSFPVQRSIDSIMPHRESPRLIDSLRSEKLMNRIMSEFMPPSVLIDDNDNIVHIINDVSPYIKIQAGKFSKNLFHNLPQKLSLFVSTMLRKLKRDGLDTSFEISIEDITSKDKRIILEGREIQADRSSFYLISFLTESFKEPEIKKKQTASIDENYFDRVKELEREIQFSKESLQATVEELETSNEELQSSNEELIASNEELQSTNEELQSVNEELYTVNSEYQQKIEELTQLNNDINNLLKNTEIGALYLDRNLCIRKVTSIVTTLTNIMENDIGRPISHISFNNIDNSLLEDIDKVVNTLQPLDKEISLENGKFWLCRIRPYRTDNNAVDGILLTFVDISMLKRAEVKAGNSNDLLMLVMEDSLTAKTIVDASGQITYANDQAASLLGITRKQIQERAYDSSKWKITDLKGEKIPSEKLPFALIKSSGKPVRDYCHYIKLPRQKKKLLEISGYPIINSRNSFDGALFTLNIVEE